MKKTLFAIFAVVAFALIGCSVPPEDIVEKYYKAAADNNVDKAISCFSLKNIDETEITTAKGKLQMIIGGYYQEIQKNGGLASVKTALVEQEGDTATVNAIVTFKNGQTDEQRFNLIKDNGWKITLK